MNFLFRSRLWRAPKAGLIKTAPRYVSSTPVTYNMTSKTNEEALNRWQSMSDIFDKYLSQPCVTSTKVMIDHLDLNHPNLSVLDAGCGSCRAAPYLVSQSQSSLKLYLTDFVPRMVEFAQERAATLNCETKVSREDAQQLSFPNQFFDRYLSNLVLHLVPEPKKMLSEAFRVLKPGGIAAFTVWGSREKSNLFTVVPYLTAAKLREPPPKPKLPLSDKAELRDIILQAGFSHVVCWEVMNIKTVNRAGIPDLDGYFSPNQLVSSKDITDEVHRILDSGTPLGFEVIVAIAWKRE